jgi:HEXXH motif-containing protein
MDKRLCASAAYLLLAAESALKVDFHKARVSIRQAEDAVQKGACMAPAAFAHHHLLHKAIKAGDGKDVRHILRTFAFPFKISEIAVEPFPALSARAEADRAIARVFKQENERQYGSQFEACPAEGALLSHSTGVVQNVLMLLAEHDPVTLAEARHLIQKIAIAETSSMRAGTSFFAFGLIALASLHVRQSWTAYLEFIVHEAAHHVLFAHWSQVPMVMNDDSGEYRSPLRVSPRPLSGVFHAAFVLARTIRAKRIFEAVPALQTEVRNMSTSYNEAGDPAAFEAKFVDCVDVLTKYAELSPAGTELISSCREMISL